VYSKMSNLAKFCPLPGFKRLPGLLQCPTALDTHRVVLNTSQL
jgi:hypothetical protein